MKSHILPFLIISSFLALATNLAEAARLGLQGKRIHPIRSGINRRASLTGTTSLNDTQDINYTTNITLGGNQFTVIIDTGSSDLYVTGTVPGSVDTGKKSGVQYAIGSVKVDVPESSSNALGTGLIGLGPNYGSQVQQALRNSGGDAVLDRIFQQNTSTPNFITVLLGRDDDPANSFPGDLTVGEILPGYEAITSQPQLEVSHVSINDIGDQHWQTLLDADGVIGPNGEAIDISTVVATTSNKKQLTAVFDSGFSLPQVPRSVYPLHNIAVAGHHRLTLLHSSVSEAIYGDVPGSQLINDPDLGKIWTIPCDIEINISFNFGGKSFPVHPLDTSLDFNATDSNGDHFCYGAFQPISTATSRDYDLILGMAFLRNAYLYINFGDFVEGKTNQRANPYIQLLSTSNNTSENSTSVSQSEFLKVRGNIQTWYPSSSRNIKYRIARTLALWICLAVGLGGLVIAAIIFFYLRSRRVRRTPVRSLNLQSSYQPLRGPAPPSFDVYGQGYAQAGYGQGGQGYTGQPPQQGNYNKP
ncbi:hypothetical protein PHLCEN_2v7509 [Hermanssonia centrifuga]|uniref:Peptidase A1 domain-containing protein n=1 Tax=Hermanssonia centrifuga TaxID=98765 RepID=A0A2R6NWU1_9APHY|nr:hypothetical protein PHLCEN_2v7509 [Hermanssonia centrifuga]